MSTEAQRLNSRRIDAANALHDAGAHLRGLLARWNDRDDASSHDAVAREALSAQITAAETERRDAQRDADDAESEWSAAVTAERIEAEDAARATA